MEDEYKVKSFLKDKKGFIVLGQTLSTQDMKEVKQAFMEFEDKNINEIIIDMKNVNKIDSSGIGALVIYMKRLREKNKNLKIFSPKDEIKKILKLVNVYSYFEVFE